MTSYFDQLAAGVPAKDISTKGGLSYMSAGAAMGLASRPNVQFVDFAGMPFKALPKFRGGLVAVDVALPDLDGKMQRMWLPVMDQDNASVDLDALTLVDVNNSRQRCLVKAIAVTNGAGMSVFMGCDGDGAKAAKLLGVKADSVLSEVTPVITTLRESGAPYVEWNHAVAACRIVDPTFHWEVITWGENADPYREVLGGVLVDVKTVFQGREMALSLPVMDSAFNGLPADKVTVFDWNRTVMRALTKCIAFNSGYGLSVYSEEFGATTQAEKASKSTSTKASTAKERKAAAAEAAQAAPAQAAAEASKEDASSETPKAEASVPATGEASAEPAAGAKEETTGEAEFITRFKNVLKARREQRQGPGVIALFDDLSKSAKFTDAEKPVCFGILVGAAASIVTGDIVESLIAAISKHDAMKHVAADNRDLVAEKITYSALTSALEKGDAALVAVARALIQAGIAKDDKELVQQANFASVPDAVLELLGALMGEITA